MCIQSMASTSVWTYPVKVKALPSYSFYYLEQRKRRNLHIFETFSWSDESTYFIGNHLIKSTFLMLDLCDPKRQGDGRFYHGHYNCFSLINHGELINLCSPSVFHSQCGKGKRKETEWSLADWYVLCVLCCVGEGAAVLLRSLEPLQGQPVMKQLRAARRREGAKQLKDKELCNGPSKLCQALDIPRCFDRRDLATDPEVWLERDPQTSPPEPHEVVSAPRIGIGSHGEWATKPLRFYLRGHPCVSVVNKEAERQTLTGTIITDLDSLDVQF